MRLLTVAVLLLLGIAAQTRAELVSEEGKAPYYTTIEEGLAAADSGRLVAVEFYSDLCKWCKALDTGVFVDQKAIKFFSEEMVLVKIDARADTLTKKKYLVRGLPTTILMKKDGREIDRKVGYSVTDSYLKTLTDYAAGIGTLDDLLRQVRDLASQIADKYKYRGASEQARAWFDWTIEAGDPTDSVSAENRIELGDLYRRDKEYERALEIFANTARDFQGRAAEEKARIYMAVVYDEMNDTVRALQAYEDYVEMYPDSKYSNYANGQIKKLMGHSEPEK